MCQKGMDGKQKVKLAGGKGHTEPKAGNGQHQGLPVLRHAPPQQPGFQMLQGAVCWAWALTR